MIYSIVIYLVFILPFSVSKYKVDGKKWLLIKILNSLITFYIFLLGAGNLRRLEIGFSDSSYLLMKNVPLSLNITMSVLYTILTLLICVQAIKLAFRKENARVFFIWLIPFIWVFTGIEKYYIYITLFSKIPSMLFIVINNTINTLIWLSIFLFYNSKNVKKFLSAEDLK